MKKKTFLILVLLVLFSVAEIYSQAKKPTIMIMPDKNWCKKNGFTKMEDNQGIKKDVVNYDAVFTSGTKTTTDLKDAISAINGEMSKREFNLVSLEKTLEKIEQNAARDLARGSKTGAGVGTSSFGELMKTAKTDIYIELDFEVLKKGGDPYIKFRLTAFDAATDKQIAATPPGAEGEPSSSSSVNKLLGEAVVKYMPTFQGELQRHFDDLVENGREISLDVKIWDDAMDKDLPDGMDTEFNGEELHRIIRKWLNANTVKKRFTVDNQHDMGIKYTQVRIALFDADDDPQDARDWASGLVKMLKKDCKLESKSDAIGVGEVTIIIGGK